MGKIQWTDATWNPTTGCTRASTGCDNCYAFTMTKRLAGMGQKKYQGLAGKNHFNGVLETWEDELEKPLRWKKPRMVFVNSMSDLFHKDVPFEFIDKVFAAMALCPQHTFQVLTKRPDIMRRYLADIPARTLAVIEAMAMFVGRNGPFKGLGLTTHFNDTENIVPAANVWLGTSVENMDCTSRIDQLLECPAAVRFISAEPLLERTDFAFRNWVDDKRRIDWVIVGGESGPKARACNQQWIREIVEDCKLAGVACFVKQLGTRSIDSDTLRLGLVTSNRHGRLLKDKKGGDISEWPIDLRVRQFPAPEIGMCRT